jgi:hypothetical protein
LSQPESRPPLGEVEPSHHDASAGHVGHRTQDPGQEEHRGQEERPVHRGDPQGQTGTGEADRQRPALADAVGQQSPGHEGERGPRGHRAEHRPEGGEGEVVLVAQSGSERREPRDQRGERRLRGDPEPEDHPAVAPRGLVCDFLTPLVAHDGEANSTGA